MPMPNIVPIFQDRNILGATLEDKNPFFLVTQSGLSTRRAKLIDN
jgi:hypothetical protein